MTAVKQTGTRMIRWFKTFRERNRPPMKWHECTGYFVG